MKKVLLFCSIIFLVGFVLGCGDTTPPPDPGGTPPPSTTTPPPEPPPPPPTPEPPPPEPVPTPTTPPPVPVPVADWWPPRPATVPVDYVYCKCAPMPSGGDDSVFWMKASRCPCDAYKK